MSLVRTSADARTKAAMRGGAFQRLRGHRDRTLMARGATPIVSVGVARTGAAQNSFAIDPASSGGVPERGAVRSLAVESGGEILVDLRVRSSINRKSKTQTGEDESGRAGIEGWGKTLQATEQRNSEGAVPACETSLRVRRSIKEGSRTHRGTVGGGRAGVEKDNKIRESPGTHVLACKMFRRARNSIKAGDRIHSGMIGGGTDGDRMSEKQGRFAKRSLNPPRDNSPGGQVMSRSGTFSQIWGP